MTEVTTRETATAPNGGVDAIEEQVAQAGQAVSGTAPPASGDRTVTQKGKSR